MMLFAWVLLLICIEAFFSGAEIALLSADRVELQGRAREGSRLAARTLKLVQSPERIFSTTLLVTSLCIVTSSVLVALWALENWGEHSDAIAVAITSPLIVIFGEILPKTLFQLHARKMAPLVAPSRRLGLLPVLSINLPAGWLYDQVIEGDRSRRRTGGR